MYSVLACTHDHPKYQPERNPAISDRGIIYRLRRKKKEVKQIYTSRSRKSNEMGMPLRCNAKFWDWERDEIV